ncbi:excalibur calcium-binding domain-containing protein, partial [Nocardia brasiliensis]|uniref:excalibur calcium-binding domain-containing protein n=1 Tax=Nocardia brasiliensis TaxID=37326 RepID=UPI0024589431
MKSRLFVHAIGIAGLFALTPHVSHADPIPTGSAGTGSSVIDSGSAAVGSAGLTQTGSAGGAYRNCEEARAAGHAPLLRGEPGYSSGSAGSPGLDYYGDGISCP